MGIFKKIRNWGLMSSKQKNLCACGELKRDYAKQCIKCYRNNTIYKNRTREDYISKYDNWWEARVPISKHARKVFVGSDKPKVCYNCGYDKHYQVCHIKAVSDFSKESTLGEINNLNNLVALCPNCHWEFDHGLLKL